MKPVRFCKKSKKVAWDFGCFRVGRIPSDARRSDPHQLLRGCLPPQRAAFRWARAIYARRNAPSQIQGRRILSRVKDTESADGARFMAKMKATPDSDAYTPNGRIREDQRNRTALMRVLS